MNFSVKRNFYELPALSVWQDFPAFVSGNDRGLVCVVSERTLPQQAKQALDSSAKKLGYGAGCIFITLKAAEGGPQDPPSLTSKTLFQVIEGLDPLALVSADSHAANALSRTYQAEVAPMKVNRLLGRNCISFVDFANMLDTPDNKQAAWALLKKISRVS